MIDLMIKNQINLNLPKKSLKSKLTNMFYEARRNEERFKDQLNDLKYNMCYKPCNSAIKNIINPIMSAVQI